MSALFRFRHGLVPALLLAGAVPLAAQRVKLLVPVDALEARARQDSVDAPAHYELGLAYWVTEHYREAEAEFRRAIAIEPRTAPAYLALGYLPYADRSKLWNEEEKGKVPAEWQARMEEAARFRRLAFLIDPLVDLKPLALMIPPASQFGLKGNREAAYTYLMNGFGSFWDGQYGRAYGFLHDIAGDATEEQRQHFAAWFLWYEALAAAHISQPDRAIADLRILLARAEKAERADGGAMLAFSNANEYRYTLACILDQAGHQDEAISLLQEALTRDAGLYMAHVRLAAIYDARKKPLSALEERRRAVAANPDDPSLLFDLGEALARTGEIQEAHQVLRQARDANPRNVRALYVLAWVAEQLGDSAEARQALTSFLALAPSRFEAQKVTARSRLAALQ
ncbi:MAG TPA: tetratricopeptide repeat protein [Gemmatimonadales bacterium]|nr:tetratricopeptide repeat protein [Gemmatimonadales bacterium]